MVVALTFSGLAIRAGGAGSLARDPGTASRDVVGDVAAVQIAPAIRPLEVELDEDPAPAKPVAEPKPVVEPLPTPPAAVIPAELPENDSNPAAGSTPLM
jgi:hypothetical protein